METEYEKWKLAVKGLYGSELLNIFTNKLENYTRRLDLVGVQEGKLGTATASDFSYLFADLQ